MPETALPELPPSTRAYIADRRIAARYDRLFEDNALFEYDTTLLDEALPDPGTLLDLGCGTGRHVAHFARRGFSVTGVDLSDHMLAEARHKIAGEGLMARLIKGDIRRLEFAPDGFFRGAICMFSTYGMIKGRPQRVAFLNEVGRALKPQGRFVVHVHNRFANAWYLDGIAWLIRNYTIERLTNRDVGDRYLSTYRGIKKMYLHNFVDSELIDELTEGGFEVERLVYLNFHRDGPLRAKRFRRLRCNGYIAVARKRRLPR